MTAQVVTRNIFMIKEKENILNIFLGNSANSGINRYIQYIL